MLRPDDVVGTGTLRDKSYYHSPTLIRRLLSRPGPGHLAFALAVLFGVIYLPDVGHGFVKDDFQWILDARRLEAAFSDTSGFLRPLVGLSFRIDYELFGLHSYAYGLTNLGLAAACAALLYGLARTFGLGVAASLLAAAVWAFNLRGINMSVLWLSGRTALLLTLFSLLAGITFLRRQRLLCAACIMLALLSKEEAVLLPFALLAWHVLNTRSTSTSIASSVKEVWWLGLPLLLYVAIRLQSDAMTPLDAPAHYAFTFAPLAVARNLVEYIDRSWTFAAAALAMVWAIGRSAGRLDAHQMRIAACGVAWFAAGVAITIFLPVRSDLYACWPATGAALAVAATADAWFARMSLPQMRRVGWVAVVALVALVPVYWSRNERWVEIADLSAATVQSLQYCGSRCDAIVLDDDPQPRRNFMNAFGTFEPAARLVLGRNVRTSIAADPSTRDGSADGDECVLHVRLINDIPFPELVGACG